MSPAHWNIPIFHAAVMPLPSESEWIDQFARSCRDRHGREHWVSRTEAVVAGLLGEAGAQGVARVAVAQPAALAGGRHPQTAQVLEIARREDGLDEEAVEVGFGGQLLDLVRDLGAVPDDPEPARAEPPELVEDLSDGRRVVAEEAFDVARAHLPHRASRVEHLMQRP